MSATDAAASGIPAVSESPPEEPLTADDQVDWWLQQLVEITNAESFEGVQITLQVGGLLVSGNLVSRDKYFEDGMAKAPMSPFSTSPDNSRWVVENFGAEAFREAEKSYVGPIRTWFVHLRDAKVFHPGGAPLPGNQGIWWRGKISAVDGFFFGGLTSSEKADP